MIKILFIANMSSKGLNSIYDNIDSNNYLYDTTIFSGELQKVDEAFYEELLMLELKYKRELNPDLIEKIVAKYQKATEYYNSIKDPRGKKFVARMKLFITRPEVIVHYKIAKKGRNTNENMDVNEIDLGRKSVANDLLRKKIEYISAINDKPVVNQEQLIKDIMNKPKDKEKATENLINDQLSKQDNQFRERLLKLQNMQKAKSFNKGAKPKIEAESKKLTSLTPEKPLLNPNAILKDNESNKIFVIKEEEEQEGEKEEKKKENKEEEDQKEQEKEEQKQNEKSPEKEEKKENNNEEDAKQENSNISKNKEEFQIDSAQKEEDVSNLSRQEGTPVVCKSSIDITTSFKKEVQSFVDILDTKNSKESNNEENKNEHVEDEVKSFSANSSAEMENQNEEEGEKSNSSEDDNIIDESLNETGNNTLFNDINNLHNIGPKQKRVLVQIKRTLDRYVKSFNKAFNSSIFPKLTDKVKQLMQEKFDSYTQISQSYQEQIITADGVEEIIEGLNDEMKNELDNNDDKFNSKIEKEENDFKTKGFKENSEFQLFEEQFRLDMCSQILDLLS